ncbi:nucleotidyltransferase family protein [Leptospira levettii]|uniref:nucleotidyltransferase family protein n=1 Tax=Leptospira levettii TaxID=2023178 RepID=UPI00223D290C|nr:nucleotidyltransferase family protein [Leptospira levettii]MCW7497017.1 nucleotidyltransferase family protein [Leptospira levettii]
MNWKNAIINSRHTIKSAIQNLNETGLQVSLVEDDNKAFLGTITDGDIRRGLLKGIDLSQSIQSIINRNSLVVPPLMSREMVLQLMKVNRIHQIPIVNESGNLVGLHLMDEILQPSKLDNLFVIMAGGKGVRLLPYTENCPKPMLPVAGKPMLEHIIDKAIGEGFQNFLISIYYLGHMIENYFKNGSEKGIKISYLREETPLGTAGALSLIKKFPLKPFVVTNGDVMTDIRYNELLEFHVLHKATATMAVRVHEWQNPFGVVKTKGVEILGFEEKPVYRNHVNAGIYAIQPDSLHYLNPGEICDMPKLFEKIAENRKRIIAYPMHEPWMDIGREEDLIKIRGIQDTL